MEQFPEGAPGSCDSEIANEKSQNDLGRRFVDLICISDKLYQSRACAGFVKGRTVGAVVVISDDKDLAGVGEGWGAVTKKERSELKNAYRSKSAGPGAGRYNGRQRGGETNRARVPGWLTHQTLVPIIATVTSGGVNQMVGRIMNVKSPWDVATGNYPGGMEKYKLGLEVMIGRKERFKNNQYCARSALEGGDQLKS